VSNNASTTLQGTPFGAVRNGSALFAPNQFSVAATPGSIVQLDLISGLLLPATLSVQLALCGLGSYSTVSASLPVCSPCLPGTYKATLGNDPCQPCPGSSTVAGFGAITVTNCTCPLGSGLSNATGSCELCSPGQYNDGSTAECQQCSGGYVSTTTGSSRCLACLPNSDAAPNATQCLCDAGYTKLQVLPSTLLAICGPCGSNTYKSMVGNDACVPCPVGTTSANGSVSVTACRCAAGYALNVSTHGCVACSPGSYSDAGSAICSPCVGNQISGVAAASCSPCTPSAVLSPDRTQCLCPQGYTGDGVLSCQECSAGTFKSTPGNSACTPCSPGYYSPSAGSSLCIAVPPSSISIDNGTVILECPTLGVSCSGGFVVSQPDYFAVWYNSSVSALRCPAGACAGGAVKATSSETASFTCSSLSAETEAAGLVSTYCAWNNACASNRTGYMCGACESGTAYSSNGNCVGMICYCCFVLVGSEF
jgi:hypothetical protein